MIHHKAIFSNSQYLTKRVIVLMVLLASGFNSLVAQESLGIVNSTYSGITGSMINPAVTVTSPFYIDINIFAIDAFAENNYIYMAKEEYRFKRFFEKNPKFPTHGDENNLIVYDYYTTKDKKAYANLRLLGPSFAVNIGRHSFGIVTGARAVTSIRNVPYDMAKFGYEKLEYPPQYDINYIDNRNIYNAELSWAEIGINYSYVLRQQGLEYWAAGITAKRLLGYAGGYLSTENVDYIFLDKDTLIVKNINAEGGYSLPVNYATNQYLSGLDFRGKGMGFDLGVIYEKKKRYVRDDKVSKLCAQNYIPYQYKIGVSLLDIGRIKFTENAQKIVMNDGSTYWPGISNMDFTSLQDLTDTVSQMFYGNSTEIYQGNEIKVALPTAISIQADVNYINNWYINGTIVYPVQFSKSGIVRPVLFGLTPRYQTELFEVSIPVTLYDWTNPRIGISARFMGFYIGTEKISGYFHYKDFTGIDFYAGLKISLRKGHCRNAPSDNCGYDEYKKWVKKKKDKKPRNKKMAE